MGKFKVGFLGTSELSYIFLKSILSDTRFTVPFIITKPDFNKKRSGLLDLLSDKHLVVYTDSVSKLDPTLYDSLDCVLVVAYGEKIPNELLLRNRWINIHGSILPQLRGASPIQHAIALGFETTGLTLTLMNEQIDSGPIISTIEHKINTDDTFGTLATRMGYSSIEWFKTSLISFLLGGISANNQNGNVTKAPIIRKTWTVLDWSQPAEMIDRKIRALNPTPLAITSINGLHCKVLEGYIDHQRGTSPGMLLSDIQLIFQTGTTAFRITKLIPSGRKMMTDEEFLRGFQSGNN